MQKTITCLWFDSQAEEAARFYVSLFKNSCIGAITYYSPSAALESGQPENSVLTVDFVLDGQSYMALNGGPGFKFTHATSIIINCDSQEEVDYFWNALGTDGQYEPCGWLTDRYGLSWQVVPTELNRLLEDPDPVKAEKVMIAMLKMSRLDIAALRAAYNS